MTTATVAITFSSEGASTVRTVKRYVGTTGAGVVARIRSVASPSQELTENEQDLRLLEKAAKRYQGTDWRSAFKELK
jgi:hypothetical protein